MVLPVVIEDLSEHSRMSKQIYVNRAVAWDFPGGKILQLLSTFGNYSTPKAMNIKSQGACVRVRGGGDMPAANRLIEYLSWRPPPPPLLCFWYRIRNRNAKNLPFDLIFFIFYKHICKIYILADIYEIFKKSRFNKKSSYRLFWN